VTVTELRERQRLVPFLNRTKQSGKERLLKRTDRATEKNGRAELNCFVCTRQTFHQLYAKAKVAPGKERGGDEGDGATEGMGRGKKEELTTEVARLIRGEDKVGGDGG
jgi:hypothetical protein